MPGEKLSLKFTYVALKIFRLNQLILTAGEKLVQVMYKRARLCKLLVKLQAKFGHPSAQENPDVDLIQQQTVYMMPAQNVQAEGMKCGNDRQFLKPGQGRGHAPLHLLSGLFRESECQNILCAQRFLFLRGRAFLNQVNDALSDDAGFAGARPCNDQQRTLPCRMALICSGFSSSMKLTHYSAKLLVKARIAAPPFLFSLNRLRASLTMTLRTLPR